MTTTATRHLALLDQATRALAEVQDVSKALEIHDQAEAIRHFCTVRDRSDEAAIKAAEIKLRAARRVGELLPKTGTGHGGQADRGKARAAGLDLPTQRAAEFRKLAAVDVDVFEAHVSSKIKKGKQPSQKQLLKEDKRRKAVEEEAAAPRVVLGAGVRVVLGNMESEGLMLEPGSVDVIVTDPPYPKEYLHLFDSLAEVAEHALKDGGSLFAMVGQSYLPQIMDRLSGALRYHWTLAYLTPGGQAVQLWDRKVNTFWKPVLWYTKGAYTGSWLGDVARSKANDNDKRYHHWGQSESGMLDLVQRCTQPGDLVLDPFSGGGTTGAACIRLGRRFVGFENDSEAHQECLARLERESALCV